MTALASGVSAAIKDGDKTACIALMREMLLIRELEQRSLDLSMAVPPEIVGSVHLCAGQEAVPAGALAGLGKADQVIATYRGHGWALASGLSLVEVLGEICHRSVGINGGRGGSAYMMAPERRFIGENSIVGAGLPIACGVAMSNLASGNGQVVSVSLGDGAFNQGATHEGLAFAAARSLAGSDHLREQSLVGADADFIDVQGGSHRATGQRLWHSGGDDRWHRSARGPGYGEAGRRPRPARPRPGSDRMPRAEIMGPLQPRYRALPPEGRSRRGAGTRSAGYIFEQAHRLRDDEPGRVGRIGGKREGGDG